MIKNTISSAPESDKATNETLRATNQFLQQNSISLEGNVNVEVKEIEINVPTVWTDVSLEAPWVNFNSGKDNIAQYAKLYDGNVEIVGRIKNGVIGTAAFSLPTKYRPHSERQFATSSNGALGIIRITTSGSVIPLVGSNVSFFLNCRFVPQSIEPVPLSCFPIKVQTRIKTPPRAVWAMKVEKPSTDGQVAVAPAYSPSWTFNGGLLQITDIPGLEYNCKQVVRLMIVGE